MRGHKNAMTHTLDRCARVVEKDKDGVVFDYHVESTVKLGHLQREAKAGGVSSNEASALGRIGLAFEAEFDHFVDGAQVRVDLRIEVGQSFLPARQREFLR